MDEFKIIDKFVKQQSHDRLILGPGDDCSVIDHDEAHFRVETTDCFIEDIHFRQDYMTFSEIAYKSLAVNISDISAMGGEPHWAYLTLALPQNISKGQVESFFEGFYKLASKHNISLVGGDLSSSPNKVFINIHLSGLVKKEHIKFRSVLAKESVLCVTGFLGDSAAGLFCLENKMSGLNEEYLIERHKKPPIELAQAAWLGKQRAVLGMMDLSDGLDSDLLRFPPCGIEIELSQIPVSEELRKFVSYQKTSLWQWALAGGEDYHLLFSCEAHECESLMASYEEEFSQTFHVIGRVKSEGSGVVYRLNGQHEDVELQRFSHFDKV